MIYFSWATQIILAIISFLWLIPYYIAFKVGNRKYMSKTLDLSCNNRYTLMYLLKTVDIRSPKTVISVHFSYSLPMAMQIY